MNNEVIYAMGIMNYCSHDPACCLLKVKGKNLDIAYAEEGFLSRKKKSYQFPLRSMKYCLDRFDIKINDINVLMLDYMDIKRPLKTSNNYRLLVGDFIRSRLNIDITKIKFVTSHHYAHALTAFWPSPFEEAAVMVVDGLGSGQQTTSVFSFNAKGKSQLLFEQKGNGIGLLYTLITQKLGFSSGEEGKTMGLAPYGENVKKVKIDELNLKGFRSGCAIDYGHLLDRSPTAKLKVTLNRPKNKSDVYKDYFTKLAFELQKETEDSLTYLALQALRLTKKSNLCFAGGVALNCVANNKIQDLKEVEGFWVQPASGDSGIPIGLALAGLQEIGIDLNTLMTRENRDTLASAYSSDKNPLSSIVDKSVDKLLRENNVIIEKFNAQKIAESLSKKQIIALYTEGIEIGPRALGHRSFLADARSGEMKDLMNSKIKHREGYRPFAPMVLKSDFYRYFISSTNEHPYMMQAPKCTEYALNHVPAICHVDGTARVQTVTKVNGIVFDILSSYKENCGESVIINTSFNDNNEPIVFTKIDAICSFLRCNADILILNDLVIHRKRLVNIGELQRSALKLQKKIMDNFFDLSLKQLTSISKKTESKALSQFIHMNDKLSRSYRNERVIGNFIEFLLSRNYKRLLFVDDFHFILIRKLCEILGLKFEIICPQIKIVEDTIKIISELKADSDFALYNVSAYFHNNFTKSWFNSHETLNSFYDLSDKKLDQNFLLNNTSPDSFSSDFHHIKNTYEHRLDLTIEKFFTKLSNDNIKNN